MRIFERLGDFAQSSDEMDSPIKEETTLMIRCLSPRSFKIFISRIDIVGNLLHKVREFTDLRKNRNDVIVDRIIAKLFRNRPYWRIRQGLIERNQIFRFCDCRTRWFLRDLRCLSLCETGMTYDMLSCFESFFDDSRLMGNWQNDVNGLNILSC